MDGTTEERLRERLTSLYGELPDDEKALLLARMAQADGAEVSGFTFGLSAVSLLGPDAKSTFEESWSTSPPPHDPPGITFNYRTQRG
jgi:hypothetical protein